MQVFSNDRDVLRYEPALFNTLFLPGQILAHGTGASLSATTLTKTGENFITKGVSAGNVIYLESTIASVATSFEVVSVDSATQLTISVLRCDITSDAISPDADASDYIYRIATFSPQGNDAMKQLTRYFGLQPGDPSSDYSAADLLDAEVMVQVSVFLIIAGVYATLASGINGQDAYWDKSFYYNDKFLKALARCKVDIDLGKDGARDLTNYANSPKLLRG